MEIASVSTNVITKSNISTSTDLLTMSTSWIQLEAHLPWHVYPDFTGYVWEVMVKAIGSVTTYVGGFPVVTIYTLPDCLQENTLYYLKSTTSAYISPKIYSFHTSVANADADIKIDFIAGEMGTGTSFNLIFIRKNYTQNTPWGGSVKLNRFIAEPLGEMACCYKDTFSAMTEATFYFAPTGETVTMNFTDTSSYAYSGLTDPVPYRAKSGIYQLLLSKTFLQIRWADIYGNSVFASQPFTITELYQGTLSPCIAYPEFVQAVVTFQTPLVIPDVRLYMPDAYLFVATGHHISVGTLEITLTYDTGTGCWVSDVLDYYNIPGRIYFSAEMLPRDFGNTGDWWFSFKPNYFPEEYALSGHQEMSNNFWPLIAGPKYLTSSGVAFGANQYCRIHYSIPSYYGGYYGLDLISIYQVRNADGSLDTALTNQVDSLPAGTPLVFQYGPMAISYSYYQRAIKSRFTAFSTFHSTTSTGHPRKGLFRDDLRDSTFWQGADRFVIRSDSNECYMTSLPPLPPPS
jgi:hypothetical protein